MIELVTIELFHWIIICYCIFQNIVIQLSSGGCGALNSLIPCYSESTYYAYYSPSLHYRSVNGTFPVNVISDNFPICLDHSFDIWTQYAQIEWHDDHTQIVWTLECPERMKWF